MALAIVVLSGVCLGLVVVLVAESRFRKLHEDCRIAQREEIEHLRHTVDRFRAHSEPIVKRITEAGDREDWGNAAETKCEIYWYEVEPLSKLLEGAI